MTEVEPILKSEPVSESEHGEIEKGRKSVWIVDDNKEHISAMLRWIGVQKDLDIEVIHYQEGEEAITEFEMRAEGKGKQPDLIFMDYKLDDQVENPKYRTGVEVIEELKKIAEENQVALPDIVAFSSDSSKADKLIAAGATSSVKKYDSGAIVERIREL